MKINTNFLQILTYLIASNRFHINFFEKKFTLSIFFLFFGFICGNLFGTFLNFFRNFIYWDGIIILITILVIEFIHFFNYTNQNNNKIFKMLVYLKKLNINKKNIFFIQILNFYKLGLLLGFFTDAFKVGS